MIKITLEMEKQRAKQIYDRNENEYEKVKSQILKTYLSGYNYNGDIGNILFNKFKKRLKREFPELELKYKMGGMHSNPYLRITKRK